MRHIHARNLLVVVSIVYLPVVLWCSWVYLQTGTFGMSSQRSEHWNRYILPHIEQYTEQRSFIEGFRDGAKGSTNLYGLGQAWFWGACKTLLSPSVPALL